MAGLAYDAKRAMRGGCIAMMGAVFYICAVDECEAGARTDEEFIAEEVSSRLRSASNSIGS